jgi:pimeloyl-ACP methyl ester carboxylesterase
MAAGAASSLTPWESALKSLRSMNPRRISFRVSPDVSLAADEWGEPDATPVVFLHGGGQTRHSWSGTARAAADAGFRAITVDHRGHGDSDRAPDGDYRQRAFIADVRAIVASLAAPPFLVGASLGGIAALMATGTEPAAPCRGLVLVDVTPRLEQRGVMRVLEFMRAAPDGFASLDEAADAIAAYNPHRKRSKDLAGLEKNLRRGADGRYRWHWDPALLKTWNPDEYDPVEAARLTDARLAAAKSLKMPVLLVRGRSSDVVSEEVAREFLALAPHAKYADLAAGHMVAGDRNDAFTQATIAFLRAPAD